jgi:superfamily II DNA or RNA helicase
MLSDRERLELQQLRLREWADARGADDSAEPELEPGHAPGPPARWSLTKGIELRSWQVDAVDAWFASGKRGTIKVVTGAGKTILALAIAEHLQHDDPQLRIAVVVPTIVLMEQWYATLKEHSDLPVETIGRLGGGRSDSFMDDRRMLIAVLASARKELPRLVREAGVGSHLLLVADECHRVGAPEMSAVLRTERAYSLGLSATPERDDAPDDAAVVDVLAELGSLVYNMSFADAIEQGVLPPFEIYHYGLPLQGGEAARYAQLSRSITDLRRELVAVSKTARKAGGGERLLAWARRTASGSGSLSGAAAQYVGDTRRRKQLLYRAQSRKAATVALIESALAERPDARVILFHESIDEVVALFELLVATGIPAVMEHSELPQELRERTLELFRAGTAQVVVSARSLIEGFNVPEADLGIIVASSSSPRQRIQSIGRVLRRYTSADGEQKTSRICVLYVRETVDDTIYDRQDWDRVIGLQRNRYFTWDPPNDPIEQPGPPRRPPPAEDEVDVERLTIGAVYPGRYEGIELSTDGQSNVIDPDGRIATNPQGIPERLVELRGRPGRFKVTQTHRAILVRRQRADQEWETLFAGVLSEPFEFSTTGQSPVRVDAERLAPGDEYHGPLQPAQELRYRQRRGGVIARRIRGGEAYARGTGADRAVNAIRGLSNEHGPITKIFLNEHGHLFWRDAGAARFIADVGDDFTFPSLQSA